jgi:hypothetical protein
VTAMPTGRAQRRRLLITVCPREPGVVVLPLTRGGRAVRLDAPAILRRLDALVAARGLQDMVRVQEGCAGGCMRPGPNVGVTIYPAPRPGARPDSVAIGWRTYVYSLGSLDCLATIIDDNLRSAPSEAQSHPERLNR